jgi:hypothetical protein
MFALTRLMQMLQKSHEAHDFQENHGAHDLRIQLREAIVESAGPSKREFIPIGQQRKLVNRTTVRHLLEMGYPRISSRELEQYVLSVCGIQDNPNTSDGQHNSNLRCKIFAILALIDQIHRIVDFIKEDVWDNDLPLKPIRNPKKDESSSAAPATFPKGWSESDVGLFCNYQWLVLAPFLSCRAHLQNEDAIPFYNFAYDTPLPFIDQNKPRFLLDFNPYGHMYYPKIHPDHHDFYFPVGHITYFKGLCGCKLITGNRGQRGRVLCCGFVRANMKSMPPRKYHVGNHLALKMTRRLSKLSARLKLMINFMYCFSGAIATL